MPSANYAQYPTYLSPINAECWYRFSSPDFNLPNWRYYAELYKYNVNTTTNPVKVGRYKVAPRPGTGEGLFTPHQILKTFVKNSVQNTATKLTWNPDMALAYALKLGFGWNPKLTYGSNTSTGALRGTVIPAVDYPNVIKPTSFTFGPGTYYYLRLATTTAHGLAVGDQITISKAVKGIHYYYDGVCTVRQVLTSTFIEVNILYSGLPNVTGSPDVGTGNISTYIETGEIVDAVRISSTMSGLRVGWNGTRQYDQNFPYDFATKYTVVANNQTNYNLYNWLSPWPHANKWKKIYDDQRETVNFIYLNVGTAAQMTVRFYNAAQVQIGQVVYPVPTPIQNTAYFYYTMETGWQTLLTQAHKNQFAASVYYSVHFGIGSLLSIGAKYQRVKRDCLYDNVRLVWLNRLGGYDYFNFSKDSVMTMNVTNKEFKKQLDYNYVTGDRQQSVLMPEAIENWTVNTDWITELEHDFLKELYSSPDVYMIDESIIPGLATQPPPRKYPVIVTDSSYKTKSQLREKMIMATVNFKMSHSANIQSQ